MADVDISQIANVSISLETLFPTRQGFGTANIIGNGSVIGNVERVRYYTSIAGVAADFASGTEENDAATTAFAQDPQPERVGIGRANTGDVSGELLCGDPPLLADFPTAADCSFSIEINGSPATDVLLIDLSSATSYEDIATEVTTGLVVATCTWTGSRFLIVSSTPGASSAIGFLAPAASGTDISGATGLGGRSEDGAITADGYAAGSLTGELDAIDAANSDWYAASFTRDFAIAGTDVDDISAWFEARTKMWFVQDSGPGSLSSGSTGIAATAFATKYNRTYVQWHQLAAQYAEVAAMVRGIAEDFTPGTALTLKFKKLATITPIDITEGQRIIVQGYNANVYVTVGGNPMNQEGKMSSGEFFDIIHGRDWLQNAIATNIFGYLYVSGTKIPYTDTGIAGLENQTQAALDEGVAANFIAADLDEDGNLVPAYTTTFPRALAQPVADRSARQYRQGRFTARVAGAVHFVDINGTLTV